MKKYLLLFAVLVMCFTSRGQSIPIDSFYIPGATWTQAVYYDDQFQYNYHFHSWGVNGIVFRIERDTIVSGIPYHLLSVMSDGGYGYYYSVYTGVTTFSTSAATNDFTILGRIRVAGNRVYFTRDNNDFTYTYGLFTLGTEYLIYDFNLTTGSSVIDTPGPGITVAGVDAVTLSSGRPVDKFSDTSAAYYWLRGIGSSRGFLFDYQLLNMGPGIYERKTVTLCYDNPSFFYHFQFTDSILSGDLQRNCFDIGATDFSFVGVKNVNPQTAKSISIYPDPLTGNTLHFDGDALANVTAIGVYNVAGSAVYRYYNPFPPGSKDLAMELIPGIYFLKIELDDGTSHVKKITKF